jgi:hypothetical protein
MFRTFLFVVLLGGACAPVARAAPIVFTPPPGTTTFASSAIGEARSVIFEVTDPVRITAAGIELTPQLASFSLQVRLFRVDPTNFDRDTLVATSDPQNFTTVGQAFYDVPFVVSLLPGITYELSIQPPIAGGFGLANFTIHFFEFQGFPPESPPNEPFTVGAFRILDGGGSDDASGASNFLLAPFQVTVGDAATAVIPEPTSALTAATIGLITFYGTRRRGNRSASGGLSNPRESIRSSAAGTFSPASRSGRNPRLDGTKSPLIESKP